MPNVYRLYHVLRNKKDKSGTALPQSRPVSSGCCDEGNEGNEEVVKGASRSVVVSTGLPSLPVPVPVPSGMTRCAGT